MPHPMDAEADEDLVRLAQKELPYETGAFEVLVRRHHGLVLRAATAYLRNSADAEDVAQEVFVSVFRSLPDFAFRSSFRSWLYRIVQNRCATRHRKVARRRRMRDELNVTSLDDPTEKTVQEIGPMSGLNPVLESALSSLSEKDQEVLILVYISELSIQEAADSLEIGLSSAKMRVKRAREHLLEAVKRAELRQQAPSLASQGRDVAGGESE